MKVKIGSYPGNIISTLFADDVWFQWRYKKYSFEIDNKDIFDRIFLRCLSIFETIVEPINIIGRKRKRKEKVVIHHYDTWSMDHTLALIILPMLKQLQTTKKGSPQVDPKDAPHISKDYDAMHARWDYVISEMIWAFEQIVDEDKGREHYYVPYKKNEKVHRLAFGNTETGEIEYMETEEEARKRGKLDMRLYKQYNKRINNGLMLFGKYYRGLWD